MDIITQEAHNRQWIIIYFLIQPRGQTRAYKGTVLASCICQDDRTVPLYAQNTSKSA